MDAATLGAFLVAAGALVVTPGPDTATVLAQALRDRDAGLRAALGVSLGVCVHATAAALGLAALLRARPVAFEAVRLAGAAYLGYLGLRTLRGRGDRFDPTAADAAGGFRAGLFTNVLNPKVALFFLAFLPGFVAGDAAAPTLLFLGGCYALLTAAYLGGVAAAADGVTRHLRDRGARLLEAASGVVLVGFGAAVALL